MAHYALIDSNNIVVNLITGVDEDVTQVDTDGTIVGGSSEAWEQFYSDLSWFHGLTCKRTSFNNRIRKQFAQIGYVYYPEDDVFLQPKPFPSWVLDENHDWQSPIPMPTEGLWVWNESLKLWEEADFID